MKRITESQLVLPALYLMSKSVNGFVSTSDLISGLTEVLHPTGVDAEILSGRSDTYFSQKVRNLKSHDTFQRDNYATNVPGGFVSLLLERSISALIVRHYLTCSKKISTTKM